MRRFILAAGLAAAALAGGAASAATVVYNPAGPNPSPANKVTSENISAGDFVTSVETLSPGDTAQFEYTAMGGPVRIGGFALSGTGNNGGADISNVQFGFTNATTQTWSSVVSEAGNTASANGSLPGLTLANGETFSIYWEDGVLAPVGVTASFSVTAVPLPAGGLLLVGALGALGVARRKF